MDKIVKIWAHQLQRKLVDKAIFHLKRNKVPVLDNIKPEILWDDCIKTWLLRIQVVWEQEKLWKNEANGKSYPCQRKLISHIIAAVA